jgi:hypothetical protein
VANGKFHVISWIQEEVVMQWTVRGCSNYVYCFDIAHFVWSSHKIKWIFCSVFASWSRSEWLRGIRVTRATWPLCMDASSLISMASCVVLCRSRLCVGPIRHPRCPSECNIKSPSKVS